MESFQEYISEFKKQLEKGDVQKAYKGLMEYVQVLRTHFDNKYPDYFVSGSIYHGNMDMTYFSFFPKSLKDRKLKIGIVFLFDAFRFEMWLFGYNKRIQAEYWKQFNESKWNKYHVAPDVRGVDYIVNDILVDNPDFSDLDMLTKQIEKGTLHFINDIEGFLSKH